MTKVSVEVTIEGTLEGRTDTTSGTAGIQVQLPLPVSDTLTVVTDILNSNLDQIFQTAITAMATPPPSPSVPVTPTPPPEIPAA